MTILVIHLATTNFMVNKVNDAKYLKFKRNSIKVEQYISNI